MAENPVPVCAVADVPVNGVISREVGDELVAIYNIDGAFYATEARCTHGLADLADGTLDGDKIECSFHFGAFHVPSGKAVQPPCFINLKTYKTQVKDGHLAGSWESRDQWEQSGGRLYATSVRLLMLEVYYRHLPLYQRLE